MLNPTNETLNRLAAMLGDPDETERHMRRVNRALRALAALHGEE